MSCDAIRRAGPAPSIRSQRRNAAGSSEEHRSGSSRPCVLCEKLAPAMQTCEQMLGSVVCKQCCIGELSGHRCDWWDLCWNI